MQAWGKGQWLQECSGSCSGLILPLFVGAGQKQSKGRRVKRGLEVKTTGPHFIPFLSLSFSFSLNFFSLFSSHASYIHSSSTCLRRGRVELQKRHRS